MAYSDTYGQTVNVQTLIDHGARRCGKLAEELTSEQVLSARQSLGFLLSNLINRGIQYWAIQKEVIGLTPDKYRYTLPDGAVDTLNVLYRTMTRQTSTTATLTPIASKPRPTGASRSPMGRPTPSTLGR